MKRMMMTGCALALAGALLAAPAAAYRDIPETSPLASEVELAVNHGLMNGYDEETFGYGNAMTRAQFVTVLCRMLLPETERETGHITPAMQVPQGSAQAYYASIDAAAELGWVDTDVPFRPGAAITRGEMAEILVRALGLESAASARNSNSMIPSSGVTAFQDLPAGKEGYISVAYDIGLTKGTSATTFSPGATATRAQAAAMLERIYEKLHRKTEFSHGFYAISSYSQMDLAEELDAVSAGWSRMTWDGTAAVLNQRPWQRVFRARRLSGGGGDPGGEGGLPESQRVYGRKGPGGAAVLKAGPGPGGGADRKRADRFLQGPGPQPLRRSDHRL